MASIYQIVQILNLGVSRLVRIYCRPKIWISGSCLTVGVCGRSSHKQWTCPNIWNIWFLTRVVDVRKFASQAHSWALSAYFSRYVWGNLNGSNILAKGTLPRIADYTIWLCLSWNMSFLASLSVHCRCPNQAFSSHKMIWCSYVCPNYFQEPLCSFFRHAQELRILPKSPSSS